jgi:hypothetical protein
MFKINLLNQVLQKDKICHWSCILYAVKALDWAQTGGVQILYRASAAAVSIFRNYPSTRSTKYLVPS